MYQRLVTWHMNTTNLAGYDLNFILAWGFGRDLARTNQLAYQAVGEPAKDQENKNA